MIQDKIEKKRLKHVGIAFNLMKLWKTGKMIADKGDMNAIKLTMLH